MSTKPPVGFFGIYALAESALFEIVVVFFLGAKASKALHFQLLFQFLSVFLGYFASPLQVRDDFVCLFFGAAPAKEVDNAWNVVSEFVRLFLGKLLGLGIHGIYCHSVFSAAKFFCQVWEHFLKGFVCGSQCFLSHVMMEV